MASWKIEGKTFLITGGASGLGAFYAEAYLKEGANKVAILDINEKQGTTTTERLNKVYPNKLVFIKCDVSVEDDIVQAFDKALKELTHIDVIINNAGLMNDSAEVWRKSCEVNIQGMISFTLKGVKHMRKDEGGSGGAVINISSVAALRRIRQMPIYCGTKMAVLHFSQCLAVRKLEPVRYKVDSKKDCVQQAPFFEETGVRILTICIASTATPLFNNLDEKCYETKIGEELKKMDEQFVHQKPECAAAACLKMYREGGNGSVWLSTRNKPGKDITAVIDHVFDKFDEVLWN